MLTLPVKSAGGVPANAPVAASNFTQSGSGLPSGCKATTEVPGGKVLGTGTRDFSWPSDEAVARKVIDTPGIGVVGVRARLDGRATCRTDRGVLHVDRSGQCQVAKACALLVFGLRLFGLAIGFGIRFAVCFGIGLSGRIGFGCVCGWLFLVSRRIGRLLRRGVFLGAHRPGPR